MALILCYSMLTKSDALQKSAFKKISFVVFMIGVSIIALANADMIARLVFDKMEAGNNSYDSRMLSILGNLIVFYQSLSLCLFFPLFFFFLISNLII